MPNTRLVSAIVAAGVVAAGITAATAWAGGPGGVVEDSNEVSEAVGTGVFSGSIVGFRATAPTNDEASAKVIAACEAAGGQECTSDEVTNENLCIVSIADDINDVVAGGAGATVEAAKADAFARAAGNNTPLSPSAPIIISACP